MKAGLRLMHRMRGWALAGLAVAFLAGAVSWGQARPEGEEEFGEPPMIEAPQSPPSPASPNPPFTLPSPTPLPPEQAAPFVPAMPFAEANAMPEPASPVVRLRIQAPARAEPGKEIEYRLTIENVSGAAAHHVVVRDRLPRGVDESVRAEPAFTQQTKTKDGDTDLLWELGTLEPGQQKVIVLAVKPKGNEDVQNRAYVQFEHGQKVTTRIAKPSVRVKVTAPAQAMRYEAVSFRIEVANMGDAPLRNAVVSDELPAALEFVSGKPEPSAEKPLTWKLGDVPPHQTRQIEYQAIVKQTGTFRNKAKATASGVSATDSAAVTVGEAKLKISISGPERRLATRPIPYHITVRNLGSVPLTNVQVSEELPPGGFEVLSASANGRREGGFVRWSLGTLAPGSSHPLLLVLRAPESGKCQNMVQVKADHDLSDKSLSEETRIENVAGTPVIEIDKNVDWLVVGQKATYTIRLLNPGKNNVFHPRIFVNVPEEMSIIAERGETTGQRQGQKISFDAVDLLGKGEEKIYTIEVLAKKSGEAKLRAWWTDGLQDDGPTETWEDKTIIHDPAQPPMFATKTPDRITSLSFPQ
jgi:uncharacterized repeat protein (TIGR01451 family)